MSDATAADTVQPTAAGGSTVGDTPPGSAAPSVLPAPMGRRSIALLVVWALLLVLGFAVVLTLGQPLPNSADQRADAYAPLPVPVTQDAAIAAADRIIALDYPGFIDAPRSVSQGTSGTTPIWTVTYSRRNPNSGVRVIISGDTGAIRVSTYP